MKYNLAIDTEAGKAMNHLVKLTKAGKIAEVKEIKPGRSLNQNSYLHLILGAYGVETGNSAEKAKALYKWVNKDIYFTKFKMGDDVFVHIRSSADLDKEEMSKSIDRFRQWSAEHGYPLPAATDQEWLRQIENEIERSGYYL
jgi:hypothetical protein